MNQIELEKPVLFIEFYTRQVSYGYHEKDGAAKLPAHIMFYRGKSLAIQDSYQAVVARYYKYPFGTRKVFGFQSGIPCLVQDREVISYFVDQTQKEQKLDTVWLEGSEYFTQEGWSRSYDQVKFAYSHNLPYLEVAHKTPYHFSVLEVNEDGSFKTNFPRREVVYTLEVGQTYLFICRKEKYKEGEQYTPNQCVMLYVKNHGFHSQIHIIKEDEIALLDPARLCEEEVKIRDHRKSKLKYELG